MSWQPKLIPQVRRVRNPFYQSKEWRKCRNQYIKQNPICEECDREGKTTPGKEVDHIQRINSADAYDTHGGRYGEPLDWDNLQTLCTRHHAQKSAKERHKK